MQIQVEHERQDEALRGLQGAGLVRNTTPDGRVELAADATTAQLTRWLVEQGYAVSQVTPIRQTLEDFYLRTIGLPVMEGENDRGQNVKSDRIVAAIP